MRKIRERLHDFFIWYHIRNSGEFDKPYYLKCNPDVAASRIPAILHFIRHGASEGRNPSEHFDILFYLTNYPDVKDSGINPLYHYIWRGKAEGRKTNGEREERSRLLSSSAIFSCDDAVLILDHGAGGGTTKYLFDKLLNPSHPFPDSLLARYDVGKGLYYVQVRHMSEVTEEAYYCNWESFVADMNKIRYTSIIVNNLILWPSAKDTLEWIVSYKGKNPNVKVEFKGHDYYCICPSYTLQNHTHKYCGVQCDENECNLCVHAQNVSHCYLDEDNLEMFCVSHWRQIWNTFFRDTVDVIEVFSPSSQKIFLNTYPEASSKVKLVPHTIPSFNCCNVAILGHLTIQKGSEVVRDFCTYLDNNLIDDMRLILFGENYDGISSPHLVSTGSYDRNDLPEKLKKAKVDMVFIPSTCPETFCFTAGESIALGYPTACFDIGGQADQVKASENGVILYHNSPEYLYNTFKAFLHPSSTLNEEKSNSQTKKVGKTVVIQDNTSWDFLKWMYSLRADKSQFVPEVSDSIVLTEKMPKIIAAYLPQYHDFPENTQWFGRGFKEWTNTSQTLPQFIGHRQPHVPIDVGYYSLDNTDIMHRQAELARKYGIAGFCVYYYWFSGQKLMDKPLRGILEDKELDFPFFLFWANDNWTMAWGNGATRETLYKSEILPGDAEKFMGDVLPYMRDPRYIRIKNKPVLLIYKLTLSKMEAYIDFVEKLQEIARSEGFEGLYLISPIDDYMDHDRLEDIQKKYLLDALMEFHPIAGRKGWNNKQVTFMDPAFCSECYDVDDFVSKRKYLLETKAKVFPGLFPDWDNSPRRYNRGAWILQNTPDNYKKWMLDLIQWSRKHNEPDERFIFVNAWNEWAEGAHLEPDTYYGYAYLQKTREALEESD